MNLLPLREPISAGTHGLWLLLSLPATYVLWSRAAGVVRGRRLSVLIFGLSLACCYAGSALFHGVRVPGDRLDVYDRLDHIGIFVLIAGSYTPLVWNLMRHRWRVGILATAWGLAAVGSAVVATVGILPPLINTGIYLAMGWGALFCYLEVSRSVPQRRLSLLMLGGVFYSVGAVLNLARWPVIIPGTLGPHEIFHLFVMAGSFSHYLFMLRVVAPAPAMAVESEPVVVRRLRPIRSPLQLQPIRLPSGPRPDA